MSVQVTDNPFSSLAQPLHEYFRKVATTHSERAALIHEGQTISYAVLDQRSDWLAHHLHALGIRPQTFVAISMERSFDLLIAIWGILKAGGAYVPLDIDLPPERRAFMLADAGTSILITQSKYINAFRSHPTVQLIAIDTLWPELEKRYANASPPHTHSQATDLAYMIYTSGSTGKPKGVMIQHDHVWHQLEGQHAIAPEKMEATLLTASISFDVSVLTIFWTLLTGKPLVIPRQGQEKDMRSLASLIAHTKVTHMLTLPSLHTLLLDQADPDQLRSLRLVNVSGEVCPTSLVQKHQRRIPWAQLYNLYGPTEATVNCTYFRLPKGFDQPKVPIGQPIPNYHIFILSENMKPVSGREVGEIYIGGSKPVVARGYWKRPQLTAERFVSNPFAEGGDKLYKTGDLARWMDDGHIEFLGRVDHQVKFRGYRIELGEIEVALGNHPAVREAVVMLHGQTPQQQRMVAWLTFHTNQSASVSELRQWLEHSLPEYMIPSVFVFLERMPLTTNGKIDRKALPDPPNQRPQLAQDYESPQGPLEQLIAAQWAELLQVQPIGRHDKFFELGGHSLLAARFIGQWQQALHTSIFITTIFDHPTVASFAAMLQREYGQELEAFFAERQEKQSAHKALAAIEDAQANKPQLSDEEVSAFAKYLPHYPPPKLPVGRTIGKAVFILAPPRSGTTLLRVMLAGHPQLFAANELQLWHFDTLQQRARTYSGKYALWQEGLIRAVMELRSCDADQARAHILDMEQKGATTPDMWQWLERHSGCIVVDKSPSYALDPQALQRIAQCCDEPIFVHLVRHPWSVARSFARYHMHQVVFMPEHPYTPLQLGELIWLYSHRHILDFLQGIPHDRYIRIHYEQLVRTPEPFLRQLCAQIGIPFHEGVLDPYADLSSKMVDGIYDNSRSMGDLHFEQRRKLDVAQADKWQGVWQDNFLAADTWQLAAQLGYPTCPNQKALFHAVSVPTQKSTQDKEAHTTFQVDTTDEPIAIIGMAVRLPGADDIDTFWQNLLAKRDVGEAVSPDDLAAEGLDPHLLHQPNYVARRYVLKDADCFDAAFFGINPREAALMDPQHRVMLETAWWVLEAAGYDPARYTGRIGVVGGVARNSYLTHNLASHDDLRQQAGAYHYMLGNESSFAITRIAYLLGLKGPAIDVQTACATGGVALHLAVELLRRGEADMMLVGGGRIQPPLRTGYRYREGQPLSADGYVRPFDAQANGMVQGHGIAFVLLKPLRSAVRDGDHIYAIIKGSAINNDGNDKTGFTAPSASGQAAVIEAALQRAGISAEEVAFVEAHGTGTLLGDPIELTGLTQAFRKYTQKKHYCALHSVKAHLGHLDAGAGIIGLITAALALARQTIPALQHFQQPNPQVDWENSPFIVPTQPRLWPRQQAQPRRAGVSSFGLGGTNAHLVLEEAPTLPPTDYSPRSTEWLCLSAKNEAALQQMAQQLATHFEQHNELELADVAFTLSQRPQLSYRLCVLASDIPTAIQQLRKLQGRSIVRGQVQEPKKIGWLFPGGGSQYVGMAAGLYQALPIFRKWVDELCTLVAARHQLQLNELFQPHADPPQVYIERPSWALPALFVVEVALVRTLEHFGIRPDYLIGHSAGAYVAAHIAGVFALEDALDLVVLRGKLFESIDTEGAMLSVALSEAALNPWLDESLSIAAINKPDNCVVAGPVAAIDALAQRLSQQDIDCRRLHIRVAAHSPQIEPILPAFAQALEQIELHPPTLPIISNLTGQWADPQQMATPQYWIDHLRQPVRWADGIATLLKSDVGVCIEVGPGQTLTTFTRQHPQWKGDKMALATLRHPREQIDDCYFFLRQLAQLWTKGVHLDPTALYEERRCRCPLPTYPFARQRHWIEPAATGTSKSLEDETPKMVTNNSLSQDIQAPHVSSAHTSPSRQQRLEQEVKKVLTQLSGLSEEALLTEATFLELGFDSLFLSQIVIALNEHFDTQISFRQLFEETPTIAELVQWLDAQLPSDVFTPPSPSEDTSPPQPLAQAAQALLPQAPPNVAALIQQQLELMARQLDLLQGKIVESPPATKPAPPPATSSSTTPPKGITAKLKRTTDKRGPIELDAGQRAWLQRFIERYTRKTAKSKALAARHKRVYADPRAITGFHRLWKEVTYQLAAEQSKGSRFTDLDGNQYIDYVMSYGVALFGHSPDFVREAIRQQLDKGTGLDLLSPLATEVGERLCRLSGKDRMTLANTGTEALVAAVRAARAATGRDKIAVFDTDYHGLTDEFLLRAFAIGDKQIIRPLAAGIPQYLADHVLVLDYHQPDKALSRIEEQAHQLAAVVVEPIQAQNPHWQHFELMPRLRELTQRLDIPLIFDEIINGFRLHARGAQAWYDVEADIVAYGKAITGGLPLAAIAGHERYLNVFDGGPWQFGDASVPEATLTYFAGTFIKNPLSLASAHAALTQIEQQSPQLQAQLNRTGYRFAHALAKLFSKMGAPLYVTATSSIFNIKFADNNPLNQLFFPLLALNGVHMRARPCFISTAHGEDDLQQTLQAVGATLEELLQHGIMKPWEGELLNAIVAPPWWSDQDIATAQASSFSIPQIRLLEKEAPLTDSQQEIFLQHQLSEAAGKAYIIGTQIHLKGVLDRTALQKAIAQLVQRHEALRMTINESGTHMRIAPERSLELPYHNLSDMEAQQRQSEWERLLALEGHTPFDLKKGPLSRFRLVQLQPNHHVLLLTVHHIAVDGWSLGILTRELGMLYAAQLSGQPAQLPPAVPVSRYAREEVAWQQSEAFTKHLEWWHKQFAEGVPTCELPTDFPRPAQRSFRGGMERLRFDAPFAERLKKSAHQLRTTLFIYMLAAFEAFLYRLSGQQTLVVGIAAAGHNLPRYAQLVAHAIHLLPLRTQIDDHLPFGKWISTVRQHVLDAFEHQRLSLGRLVRSLDLPRSPARNTLVSVVFNMDSPLEGLDFGPLEITTQPLPRHYETFDIYINLKPVGQQLWFEWNYNADLWRPETIRMRLAEFETFLKAALEQPEQTIAALPLLPSTERALIHIWQHGCAAPFKWQSTLHALLENTAQRWPDRIAVRQGTSQLTFRQLNQRANQVAYALRQAGHRPGQRVGVMLDRHPRMLAVLYGILKAGGAYVPVETFNPLTRARHIVQDAACQWLITARRHRSMANQLGVEVLDIDQAAFWQQPVTSLAQHVRPEQEAYIIYTSGSTGQPKGVAIAHQAALHTLLAIDRLWQIGPDDRCVSVSSMSFDMSIPDYFLMPARGATLILVDDETRRNGLALRQLLEQVQPTVMQATPATWRMLLAASWPGTPQLRAVAGGEALTKDLAAALLPCVHTLWNGYGPTETAIYATWQRVTEAELRAPFGETIPIGRPLAHVSLAVLDCHGQPVGVGIPGELYISGPGVAIGYLNSLEQHQTAFITRNNGSRWYRTGDRVRHLPTGELEFLGRGDAQIKIRGYRIEIGEVEARLNELSEVREGVVHFWPKGPKGQPALVAYYVPTQESHTTEQVRNALSQYLPEWMMPTHFMPMTSLPRNSALKVDRQALPEPQVAPPTPAKAKVSTATTYSDTENWLAEQWQSLLGHTPRPDDDFFALGGHSLLATQLMATIYKEKGIRLPLATLLQYSTLRQLAAQIDAANTTASHTFSSLVPIRTQGKKAPLFLVHGGGLHVLFYEALTRHMDKDRPIYALQAKGLDGREEPLARIEDMAVHYIREIKQVQPQGPYHLAGYSLGGLIAFEMARQLAADGELLGEVALFDAVAKDMVRQQKRWWKRLKKAGYTLQLLVSAPIRTLSYKSQVLHTQLKHLIGKWRIAWFDPQHEQLHEGYLPFGKKVYDKCLEAYERYQMQPAPVSVTVFRAKEQMFYLEDADYLGWKDFALGGVEVIDIEGNHLTLFDEPHVQTVARILSKRLAKKDHPVLLS